jgi:hypothetical protein
MVARGVRYRAPNWAESQRGLEASRRSVNRGQPFGSNEWAARVAKQLDLDSAFRSQGRPRKELSNNGS